MVAALAELGLRDAVAADHGLHCFVLGLLLVVLAFLDECALALELEDVGGVVPGVDLEIEFLLGDQHPQILLDQLQELLSNLAQQPLMKKGLEVVSEVNLQGLDIGTGPSGALLQQVEYLDGDVRELLLAGLRGPLGWFFGAAQRLCCVIFGQLCP